MKICFHSHCFPDALAPRAIGTLAENAKLVGMTPHTDGTAAGTLRYLQSAGIDTALICNIATNPHQERKVNDFAIALAGEGKLFSAGSIHPESEDPEGEMNRLWAAGIKGMKIHPDYVGVSVDDPRYDRIFSLAEERGFFVVTHTGLDPVSPDRVHATAQGLLRVIRKHPGLNLIAAHMGGIGQTKEVIDLLVGTPIWFDTSLSALREDEWDKLRIILREHSADRILFGTDTPWSLPGREIAFLEHSRLSEKELESIFANNAKKLLQI
ncbi:MAG: metal-dependent hydrolase [Ruminococcaceae bacterium]|nr:metal-dependent hydrolase [Oscillospiraceae bacterium]